MAASQFADGLLKSAVDTYFQLLDKPLPGYMRFLYATLGALSLFLSAELVREIQYEHRVFSIIPVASTLAPIVVACLFGLLISLANTRHGPIRLYLSGVLLPAFVVAVIRATWSIDIVNEVGGAL